MSIQKNITIIVAMSQNGVIGKGNNIPWKLPNEQQFFKHITVGSVLIMGKNTFDSVDRRCLPDRQTIVISSTEKKDPQNKHKVCGSLEEAIVVAETFECPIFIVGGGKIYQQAMKYAYKIHVTTVDITIEDGDVFFPKISLEEWKKLSKDLIFHADEENPYEYKMTTYLRLNT